MGTAFRHCEIQMLLYRSREHTYHKVRTNAVKIKIKCLLNKKDGSESHEITTGAKENKQKRSVLNLFSAPFTQVVTNEKKGNHFTPDSCSKAFYTGE